MTNRPDRSSDGFKTNPQLEENKRLLFEIMAEKEARAEAMPTEADAMRTAMDGYQRLLDLGWRPAMYCPKDGTMFSAITPGSTGIFPCRYDGEWPDGTYWLYDGDIWPGNPMLFRERREDDPQFEFRPVLPGYMEQELDHDPDKS